MNILVTAGNTQVPIDRVRCLTNIFSGRTGAVIALASYERGHSVTLCTSHPETVAQLQGSTPPVAPRWRLKRYSTFDDLHDHLQQAVHLGGLDVLIHAAAVSDYRAASIYAPAPGTQFRDDTAQWESTTGASPALVDMSAGKVKSDAPELWLRLLRAPKLVDLVRRDWGFQGILVKFKLEVGISDQDLLQIAERSRRHSAADLMVANTLEGAGSWAYLGPLNGQYQRIARRELAARLLDAVEALKQVQPHG
jgi:phosphopantothenoylcysteine synthetase/decarboxylase